LTTLAGAVETGGVTDQTGASVAVFIVSEVGVINASVYAEAICFCNSGLPLIASAFFLI